MCLFDTKYPISYELKLINKHTFFSLNSHYSTTFGA